MHGSALLPALALALTLSPPRADDGAHAHAGTGGPDTSWLFVVPFVVAAVAYLGAATAERRGGRRSWPWYRDVAWVSGLAIIATALAGPLAAAAHADLVAHMVAHLLAGMLAPLLLVAAAPITLALRVLDVTTARRLARILGSRPARVLTHPVAAATLNVGSMWVLYTTPLAVAMRELPLVHELVILHLLLAGFLFTTSIVSVDPAPHRSGFRLRLVVLVLSIAAHAVLAKHVYALASVTPPGSDGPGAGAGLADSVAEAERAGLLMYYGGDALELVLVVAFFVQWYRAAGRRLPVPVVAR